MDLHNDSDRKPSAVNYRWQRQKRVFAVLMGMSAILMLFIVRLGWLQLAPSAPAVNLGTNNMRREAVAQREKSLELDSGRGDFVDRHGQAMTGESYRALAIFPLQERARGDATAIAKLAAALSVPTDELKRWMRELQAPSFWQGKGESVPHRLTAEQLGTIGKLRIGGVRVMPYRNRYPGSYQAMHAIGYVSQHPEWLRIRYASELAAGRMKLTDRIGGAGLERSLERLLRGVGPTIASYYTDGANKPLNGLDMRLLGPSNPYYPLQIVTTIDLALQNEIEAYVDASGLDEGAVVVLDAANGDIIAMVSRPQLSPSSLGAKGTDTANHAIRAVAPGSIFKLVTAAAALEAGLTEEEEHFECDGEYGRYGLHCWKEGGHGRITMHEALAQSCNIAFATIAERLSARELSAAADKLGIGRLVGWAEPERFAPLGRPLRLLEEEEAGGLFASIPVRRDGGQLAQTGIGQRDVRMTPLQAANLIVTLLHEGRVNAPRLVSEIRYANGQRMVALPQQAAPSQYGRIAPETARALLRGMVAVVSDGTARSIRQGTWAVAGKSGTAETVRSGIARSHQWFAGYGPVNAPRYTVAVLAENRPPNTANKATALFRGIMDLLAAHETTMGRGHGNAPF
ncbi:Penicillin-binding protein 4B [Paenibacillus plantiphilus]|uniref:Penicillin-binding protein 4B n=1 Tax=Paenibacillus plantiphilus TaxID=2905650 RepID=A0ABN8HAD0_9BACL|nr:penicillin-binding transpeptidase domain-containing protein [Paenibacillus plantiphilus]CAH1225933.1 Penicillin-binding protein 4B [Paenibacillus plantiphilus]